MSSPVSFLMFVKQYVSYCSIFRYITIETWGLLYRHRVVVEGGQRPATAEWTLLAGTTIEWRTDDDPQVQVTAGEDLQEGTSEPGTSDALYHDNCRHHGSCHSETTDVP